MRSAIKQNPLDTMVATEQSAFASTTLNYFIGLIALAATFVVTSFSNAHPPGDQTPIVKIGELISEK